MKTSVLVDHEPAADGGYLVRALLTIEGPGPDPDGRAALNLCLVLDRSGSMHGEKLRAAREAGVRLVRHLAPEDRLGVVAYDDRVDVVAAPATGADQRGLTARIRSIGAGGCTNLSGGWLLGRDLVAAGSRDGGANRIILLTDGLANVGITDPDTLTGLCRTAAEAGLATTTVGFGAGYDEDLLKAMADAGRGGAYYIERPDQAVGIFEEELEGLLSLAAQNLRVSVAPGAHADFVRVLHDYPAHAEGDVLTLDVGDLYAREPRRILMEFVLRPWREEDGEAEVAHLTVCGHVLTSGGGVELQTLRLPITLSPVEGGRVDPEVRREQLLVEAARAREDALRARDEGDRNRAENLVRQALERIRASGVDDDEMAAEAADLEHNLSLLTARELSPADVKYMKQWAHSAHRSRRRSRDRFRRGE